MRTPMGDMPADHLFRLDLLDEADKITVTRDAAFCVTEVRVKVQAPETGPLDTPIRVTYARVPRQWQNSVEVCVDGKLYWSGIAVTDAVREFFAEASRREQALRDAEHTADRGVAIMQGEALFPRPAADAAPK